jgi:sugar (pentulose or hexulose) kinase
MNLYLGIDFGTSGTRAVVIDAAGVIQAEAQYSFELVLGNTEPVTSTTVAWKTALFALIEGIPQEIRREIKAIAFDGTSSTVLLCDSTGQPITEPLMYNDGRGIEVMERLNAIAPPNHTVLSATSSLAKLLWLTQNSKFKIQNSYFLHQADWLAFLLHGQLGISDYHNALKLGYDVDNLCYPDWLENLQISIHLPKIVAPGTPIANVLPEIANELGLPKDCIVCAGTTDSIEAVTSLGSTLVLKLLSHTRVDDARYGIYSHRLGDLWLVGGASNTGGAVLRHFFSDAELESFSCKIPFETESPLEYYPLLKEGDRFPINDPHLPPNLEPRPADSVEFLHGLLESIARIEARGYRLLQQLGATQLTHVYTAGGGAKNPSWRAIRERQIGVPLLSPNQTAAAYGTALLAKQGYRLGDIKPCT